VKGRRRFNCIGFQSGGAIVSGIFEVARCSSMMQQVSDFSAFIYAPDMLEIAIKVSMGDTNV
jgi:hypothetical protein